MRFSRFAPLGLFRLKGGTPTAKLIYDDMIAGLGGEDGDLHPERGTHLATHCFATSIEAAFAKRRNEVARNQALPFYVTDLLPNREAEYGVIPAIDSTDADRRTELARRMLAPIVPSQANIEDALTDLLGDDFIAYRPTLAADAIVTPATVGAAPANLQRPEVTRKAVALSGAVSFIGVPVTVTYTLVTLPQSGQATENAELVAGDVLVFDPGMSIADRVTITSATSSSLTAIFSKAHSAGALGFTQPIASQTSTKRSVLVVLSDTAAADPEKRRIVDDYMSRTVRATTTWAIAAGDAVSTTPFDLSVSSLPWTSLETISL